MSVIKPLLLRRGEVETLTGMSRSVIYTRIREGSFPKPVQIAPHSVRWRMADVQDWIDGLPEVGIDGGDDDD